MKRSLEKYKNVFGCLTCCIGLLSCASGGMEKSISTDFPADDWVISDFVVTDARFGAKSEPGFDNRAAFQAAIDSAYNRGGGVVYIPAGTYEFHSTRTGTKNVRVRQGKEEENQARNYEYVLTLPPGVQLRGDWADPEKNDGNVKGTILSVFAGENSPNYNGSVQSWWNDGQDNNKLHTSYTSVADRFIEMHEGTGVVNLSVWYPRQDINDVKLYPWTFFQVGGDCATVKNVTLVNAYNGFYSAPSELHYLRNNHYTTLGTGVEIHVCTDIGRIEKVDISPSYWAKSGLPGAPTEQEIAAFMKRNAVGFEMHRSDWEYISNLSVSDCKIGMWIGREPGFDNTPNSQLYQIQLRRCGTGLFVQDVNPYGLLISNSSFVAEGNEPAVYFSKDFKTSVQFNGVDFKGKILSDGKAGVVSFESCNFDHANDYSLAINSGNVLLTQCDFKQPNKHVYLGERTHLLKSVNSGHDQQLSVDKMSADTKTEIVENDQYVFKSIPKNITTDIQVRPRPASNRVLKMNLPCATGYNNDVPTVDVSASLQEALNLLKSKGGGTLYLPVGRYLVESPITVPSGVELRGSWDVQHHTQSGGTALFTNYDGGEKKEEGESLIQLEENAGLNGVTIAQLNIISDGYTKENPRKTPFLIQGKGPKVYVTNVTIAIGDKGIDLASYNTSGHYVDFLGGVLLRAGIWIGGGAEGGFVRNMQFNPHYSARLPKGMQGYPKAAMASYIQSHCSALKFADVKGQTIFNNFVFGSVYGVHFLRDAITGKCPGEMTMVGHGSDGCTYSLFVEDADERTNIIGINSELVNTNIKHEPVRSYVLMGKEANTDKVSTKARLTLFNSAFWGSPVIGSIVNNGTLRLQQGNFTRSGRVGIDLHGGEAHVFSTYFAQPMEKNETYVQLRKDAHLVEMTNNFYTTPLEPKVSDKERVKGSDWKNK